MKGVWGKRVLNRQHPAARNLASLWDFQSSPRSGPTRDLARGKLSSATKVNRILTSAQLGPSMGITGVGSNGFQCSDGLPQAVTRGFTFACLYHYNSGSGAPVDNDSRFFLIHSGSAIVSFIADSGGSDFFIFSGLPQSASRALLALRYDPAGTMHYLLCASGCGTEQGGIFRTTDTQFDGTFSSASSDVMALGASTDLTNQLDGGVYWAATWDRCIPESVLLDLFRKPDGLFVRRRTALVGAAGGAAVYSPYYYRLLGAA